MVDLARWLGQQLDTDAAANESPYGEASWHAANCASLPDVFGQEASECDCEVSARVLREIDAKRRLLNDHPIVPRDIEPTVINGQEVGGPYYAFGCANCHGEADSPEVNGFGYCFTWKVIASVYVDRDGYREEWRP